MIQVLNCLPVERAETECSDMIFEGLESLFSDENMGLIGKNDIPSEPPMPEGGGQSEEGGESSSLDGCEEKEMYETAEIDQVRNYEFYLI